MTGTRDRRPINESGKPVVFLDFDGTITRRDATDAILEAYADPQWLRIEEDWKAGRLSSRACLAAQMALVTATQAQIDSLLDTVEIDTGFVALLGACAAHDTPVHIVSDGFDYCIQRILSRPSLCLAPYLGDMQIVSSHLEPHGRQWIVDFTPFGDACAHGCATCKPATMARLKTNDGPAIFVGDGLSDRYAAAAADLLFAKDALAAYCDREAIPYTPYDNLATIASGLDRLLPYPTALRRASFGRVADGESQKRMGQ
jgi:2-hydroxy-3-keto-5-methylthiopentenyl-1-phosphate phosphatase